MTTIEKLRRILADTLQLGSRAYKFAAHDRLLGAIPEFDSMAVISVITMIEEEFSITIADDEMSAEIFETLGSLEQFVNGKLGH